MINIQLKPNNRPTKPGWYVRQDLDSFDKNPSLVDIREYEGELELVGKGVGCYTMEREIKEHGKDNILWSDEIKFDIL